MKKKKKKKKNKKKKKKPVFGASIGLLCSQEHPEKNKTARDDNKKVDGV